MINRLINMEIPKIQEKHTHIINDTNYSIKDFATTFINGLGETQQERFKKMLESGVQCGLSIAENYGIDYDKFITEVKKQMGVV